MSEKIANADNECVIPYYCGKSVNGRECMMLGEHAECVPFPLSTAEKVDEIHSIIGELKGLESKLLPILEGMQKNPMLKMFFK